MGDQNYTLEMAQGAPTSHEEICGFEQSISRPVQPHIAVAFARTINPHFMRTIQVGFPGLASLVLQYRKGQLAMQGGITVDGNVSSGISYAITPDLTYSFNAMCAPVPESFKTQHSLEWSVGPTSITAASDFETEIDVSALHYLPPTKSILHIVSAGIKLRDPSAEEGAESGSHHMATGSVGHFWMSKECVGSNVFRSQDYTLTSSVMRMIPERQLQLGASFKGHIVEKNLVVHGCAEFQVPSLPVMMGISVGSDKMGSLSLMTMLGPLQGRIVTGYGIHGFTGGFAIEINENVVVR